MFAFFYQHQPDPSWDPKPRPSVEAPFCELQSHGAVQLRPAGAAGILTLSSGELRITGCLGIGLESFDDWCVLRREWMGCWGLLG